MNISLRQLRAFLAVAESRNFSRAGELMALTQPAVSRNVTELEQALGVQLLHRTTREVELTDAGRLLQGHATRVLDALDECLLEVSGLATQRLGKVRVASSPTLSAHLMPRCIARCREQAPGIELLLGRDHLVEKMRRFIAIYDKTLKDQITTIARIDLRYSNGLAVGWREPIAPTTAQPAVAKN